MSRSSTTDKDSIIWNSRVGKLYPKDFGKGRYFRLIHHGHDGFTIQLAEKTQIEVVYIHDRDDIDGLMIDKVVRGKQTERLHLSKFNFQQLRAFLEFVSTTRLADIPETRLSIFEHDELNPETVEHIRELLKQDGGAEIISSLLSDGSITSADIVNTGYRKSELNTFRKLLEEVDYWKEYAGEQGISTQSEERVWQYFFNKNDWIFGYGLEYRFNGILQKEFRASESQGDGSGEVITDFLLGDTNFTTFVEVKKPSTPLFGGSAQRTNAWRLSTDLFDSVSQILEQKASGQTRLDGKTIYDDNRQPITNKAYDSKVVLVIGDWSQNSCKDPLELEIKKKTFELFRRDSRNIKILTFDELFERATFIVYQRDQAPKMSGKPKPNYTARHNDEQLVVPDDLIKTVRYKI